MQSYETIVCENNNGFSLKGTVIVLDNSDIIVIVTGGRDHIGAVGLAVPRPSLSGPDKLSATSSILTQPGHKEDVMVKYISEKLAAATDRSTAVIAGVHYDDLTANELKTLHNLWITLTGKIITFVNRQ